jgi:hypothetical protein
MQIEKSLLYQRILFVAFWIRATYNFVAEELVPVLYPFELKSDLFFDAVIVFLGIITLRKKVDIFMLSGFVLVSWFITCEYNNLSFIFFANGLRDFITFLFVIPILHYFFNNDFRKKRFVESFDKQIFIFLVLQVVCIFWQYIKYGGGDHGGGSLGNFYSGTISILIYLSSFYLIQKRIDKKNYISSIWENKIYIFLLFPTFFNETKISFILFVVYFLLLLPIDRKLFIRIVFLTPLLTILVIIAGYLYLESSNSQFGDLFNGDNLELYFKSDADNLAEAKSDIEWNNNVGNLADVPRITKLMLLPELDEENPGHVITGFGLGHFKGKHEIKPSKFSIEYDWLLHGTIPYSFHLIIQLGVVGIVWFIFFWIVYLGVIPTNYKRNRNLQLFLFFVIISLLIYFESFRYSFFGLLFFFFLQSSWDPKQVEEDIASDKPNEIL